MPADHNERQINVRGEIFIDGPARLIGSFTGIIADGRIVTSGNVSIGDDADVHASIEPDAVSIEPGAASLTYVPAPSQDDDSQAYQQTEQPAPQLAPRQQQLPAPVARQEGQEPAQVSFPNNRPPQVAPTRRPANEAEDNAAKQARARLAAYSRKAATGTDDPSGWAAS